ncbi:acyltransferase [Streptomyces sp. NPDC056519]|uniref:acyltransferase family protein n=1 Tax=Streptomyces sp. NPDC056519 TaxID=3345849 RepID=UPI0036C103D0
MPELAHLAPPVAAPRPADRDRAADALRALAIAGMVLGQWLVTAIINSDDGALTSSSALTHIPALTPLSWIFQTLAVFFLAGGHSAAGSWARAQASGLGYRAWLTAQVRRLTAPVGGLLALWAITTVALLVGGVPVQTLRTLPTLVLSPLSFLLVFTALTAATPLIARLNVLWPLAVVLHVDLLRFAFGAPTWLGWINVVAGWMVPYCLGTAWARGAFASNRTAWGLTLGGAVTTAALLLWGGYPAPMVGVPVSNLSPPTLAAITFGLTQCGLALLLREPLRRAMRRRPLWAAVSVVNLSAFTIFIWHQTAMLVVTSLGTIAGRLPGLGTAPDSSGWMIQRIGWIPLFVVALAACWAAFHPLETRQASRATARGRRHTGKEMRWPLSTPDPRKAGHGEDPSHGTA